MNSVATLLYLVQVRLTARLATRLKIRQATFLNRAKVLVLELNQLPNRLRALRNQRGCVRKSERQTAVVMGIANYSEMVTCIFPIRKR
ncbi:hypothetical protein O9993_09835 [Vibrio lentus]|nr:hypothetical protein [Vibrio lentus]